MAGTYGAFLVVLAVIAALGAIASLAIASLALEKVAVLAGILASITAAGLLSLAFVADTLTLDTVSPGDLFGDKTASQSLFMVVVLLAAGASGLLAALALTVANPMPDHWPRFLAGLVRCLCRWCAGCLAVATAATLLLFPAVVVLILTASDLTQVP